MAPIARSSLWKFFERVNRNSAKCRLCLKTVSSSGNTTNLFSHLLRNHPDAYSTSGSDEIRRSAENKTESKAKELEVQTGSSNRVQSRGGIADSFLKIESYSTGGHREAELTNLILFMIAKDNLPLSIVEKEGFLCFCKKVVPLYKIPSRKKITGLLDQKYDLLFIKWKNKLEGKMLALTTDIWTEPYNTRSFLGLTGHFIDGSVLCSIILGVHEMTTSHTAENITIKIKEVLSAWDIPPDKIICVITDNAANMKKAICDGFGSKKHLACLAHTINLIAETSIKRNPELVHIITKVKSIVTRFKQCVNAADALRKIQLPGVTPLKLLQHVQTRWNSTFYMLERLLQLIGVVSTIILEYTSAPQMLSASEIQVIRDAIPILQPLEVVTKEISGEKYLSGSRAIPISYCLRDTILELNPVSITAKTLRDNILLEWKARVGDIEKVSNFAVATLLDPRFKKMHFEEPLNVANVIKYVNNILKDQASITNVSLQNTQDEILDPQNNLDLWARHKRLLKKNTEMNSLSTASSLHPELDAYLKTPVCDISREPILEWQALKIIHPTLYKIALNFLPIVASSVPCERLFSKSGDTASKERNRLTPKRLSQLLFLNSLNKSDWE